MLDEFLGSKTRASILSALLEDPARPLHLRELVRRSGGSVSGVQRELARLESLGLVRSATGERSRREVSLVPDHPFADAVAGLVAADERAPYLSGGGAVRTTGAGAAIEAHGLNPHVRGLSDSIVETSLRFGVLRVALFGSATEADVTVVPRDLDVSVRFDPQDRRSRAELFFGLRAALERVTGMEIDLLEIDSVENPYLLRELDESEVVLYQGP